MEPRNSPFYNNEEDIISNLPDALIHHIFSFIDTKYAVQTSVLSRRWRYLWTSLPTLILIDLRFDLSESPTENSERLINFVDRVLLLRDRNSDIQKFYLAWRDENATSSRLNTWILSVLKRNVQELCIDSTVYQKFPFPPCLFTCKSLTKLELELGNKYESEIILPNSMGLPRLKSLKLTSLAFLDEKLANKLFSSCPILESLTIINSHINFNISSLTLKYFFLHNSDYYYRPSDGMPKTLQLCAPNLTYFYCQDYMLQKYSLENLSSLVTADIDMTVKEEEIYETPELYWNLSMAMKELYARRMMEFFRAVRNAKDLKLSPGFLEGVSGAPDILDSQPLQFCNLQRLQLQTWVSRNCMNAITYLLKISPNIESLCLRITKSNIANIGDDWEAGSSFQCMLYHLKFVEIQGFEGCVNELMFLEILLKNAVVLEKLVLDSYETGLPDRAIQLAESKEKLLTYPTASSNVSVCANF